jgi:hypothetical protein
MHHAVVTGADVADLQNTVVTDTHSAVIADTYKCPEKQMASIHLTET